jgi:hypothetical protein
VPEDGGHNTEYAVKLDTCDEWTMAKEGEYAATFDLDAADVFNEASLINDDVWFNVRGEEPVERDDFACQWMAPRLHYNDQSYQKGQRVFD